ncbi:MAG: WecB/TagA/CpsF family glycosyltransferase [Patescibacteria group bacterium]
MVKLLNVNLPQITKWELKEKLTNLDPTKKHTLYWLYSEFILRANRNAWYKKVLNESTFAAIDGKGLHWAMHRVVSSSFLPLLYSQKLSNLPTILRIPVFIILFIIQLFLNFLNGIWTLIITKKNFSTKTLNETILGRDFTYELLKICNLKGYKTLIIGGSNEDDQVSKELIKKLYPNLDLLLWTRKSNTLLMKDQIQKISDPNISKNLTTSNLYEYFPELIDAKKYIQQNKPDVILVCIGGASGKQEFFIHDLMNDPKSKFILATGLGAAIDHLGGGAKQKLPPLWIQNLSLEWLWRFFDQPYRRMRIIDSIFTLYWWTTLYQFTQELNNKKVVAVSKVQNNSYEILIESLKGKLPNEIGYSLPFSTIKKEESIESTSIKYINSKYQLNLTPSNISSVPEKGRNVYHSISLRLFIKNLCYYNSSQYFVNFIRLNFIDDNRKVYFVDSDSYLKLCNPDYLQFEN